MFDRTRLGLIFDLLVTTNFVKRAQTQTHPLSGLSYSYVVGFFLKTTEPVCQPCGKSLAKVVKSGMSCTARNFYEKKSDRGGTKLDKAKLHHSVHRSGDCLGGRLLLPCHRSQARTRWCFAGLRILAFLVLPFSSFLTGGLFFVQKTASALLDRWTG